MRNLNEKELLEAEDFVWTPTTSFSRFVHSLFSERPLADNVGPVLTETLMAS